MRRIFCFIFGHIPVDQWHSKPFIGDTPNESLQLRCTECAVCGKKDWKVIEI